MLSTMKFRHVAAVVAALILASCSNVPGIKPAQDAKTIAPNSTAVSPLTGLSQKTAPDNPVYYVKIENTNGGEPQYGENHADMMIEELVENGATRCIGLFYSDLPNKI